MNILSFWFQCLLNPHHIIDNWPSIVHLLTYSIIYSAMGIHYCSRQIIPNGPGNKFICMNYKKDADMKQDREEKIPVDSYSVTT